MPKPLSPLELEELVGSPVQIVDVSKSSIYHGHSDLEKKKWKLKSFEPLEGDYVVAYVEDEFKDTIYIYGVLLKEWP